LSNRCLSSVCVCGTSSTCTTGTRYTVCLDQVGNTPGSSNTVATCKVCYARILHYCSSRINILRVLLEY
jgi:hypothetical protein